MKKHIRSLVSHLLHLDPAAATSTLNSTLNPQLPHLLLHSRQLNRQPLFLLHNPPQQLQMLVIPNVDKEP